MPRSSEKRPIAPHAPDRAHEVRRAVDHRGVDHLALARPAGLEDGADHAEGEEHAAAAVVADHVQRRGRGRADATEVRERAGERDVVDVVAGGVRHRALLPPAGHAPVDQARVAGEARVGAEPEALGDPGAEALDQRVGLLHQPQHGLDAVRVLEVDADVTPAARVEHEPARPGRPADELRPLDPHDLRAHVGQERAGERPRADADQLDHLHPVQWSHA